MSVSLLGFGTWGMGDWTGTNIDEAVTSLQQAVDVGINFFDTAHSYGNGLCEELLGCLLYENPTTGLIVATKVPPANHRIPAVASDRFEEVYPLEHVRQYVAESRARLGVETLDLLQLHVWHDAWARHPQFARLVHFLKGEGITRNVGISLNAGEPDNGIEAVQTGLVDTVQVVYNLLDQNARQRLFPVCLAEDVGLILRCPLDEGSLVDSFDPESTFPTDDWRANYFSGDAHVSRMRSRDALKQRLPQGTVLSRTALQFCMSEHAVATVIVGMRKPQHVIANAQAEAGELPDQLLLELLNCPQNAR